MLILINFILGIFFWIPAIVVIAGLGLVIGVVVLSFKLIKVVLCLLIIVPLTKLIWRKA